MTRQNSRTRILEVAERLIALKGVHGTSAREVLQAAEQRNNSAIVYHFGSWDGLVAEIWTTRAAVVNEHRRVMVDAIEPGSADETLRLVEAYVHPYATAVGSRTPSYWARFNEQCLLGLHLDYFSRPSWIGTDVVGYAPAADTPDLYDLFDRLTALSAHAIPHADRARRTALVSRFVTTALAAWERDAEVGSAPDLSVFEADLTTMTLAVLTAGRAAPA
ncbi:MAG: TetR family transcriptional regulator [Gordonia sp. (in: high G+C Gram-positive bacteria)]|uniref:TetR/AcrR family transcriptional regulator n=1 Tax=Gordonia sp. (in: high G+C Gram-positive bacteria) TaxID=84139 RepID=UPI003C7900E1